MRPTAAAIIAGGQARRFGGRDKSRLVVDGRTIIVRQIEILQQVADAVFIVSGYPDRFRDLNLPVVTDRVPDSGAIGGIYSALDAAQASRVIVVACDLPFLSAPLLRHLVKLAGRVRVNDGAWVRTRHGAEPLLACYRRSARARVLAQIRTGDLKAAHLGKSLRMAEVSEADLAQFGSPERLLANINTPDDYARVQYPPS